MSRDDLGREPTSLATYFSENSYTGELSLNITLFKISIVISTLITSRSQIYHKYIPPPPKKKKKILCIEFCKVNLLLAHSSNLLGIIQTDVRKPTSNTAKAIDSVCANYRYIDIVIQRRSV